MLTKETLEHVLAQLQADMQNAQQASLNAQAQLQQTQQAMLQIQGGINVATMLLKQVESEEAAAHQQQPAPVPEPAKNAEAASAAAPKAPVDMNLGEIIAALAQKGIAPAEGASLDDLRAQLQPSGLSTAA